MSNHPIVHFEFSSVDNDKMKSFYGNVFGWSFQEWPEMNYVTFTTGEGSIGGGFNPVSDDYPAGTVVNYINCDDIRASLEDAKQNGGTVVADVMPIPGVGDFALVMDPSNNLIGLLQPSEEME